MAPGNALKEMKFFGFGIMSTSKSTAAAVSRDPIMTGPEIPLDNVKQDGARPQAPRLSVQTSPSNSPGGSGLEQQGAHGRLSPFRRIASSYRAPAADAGGKRDYEPLAGEEGQADRQSYDNDEDDFATSDTFLIDEEALTLQSPKRRRRRWMICGIVCSLTLLGILLVLNLLIMLSRAAYVEDDDPDDIFGNWGRPGTGTEGLAWYPTDFLRDVVPIPCHSHNDYWRRVPLFSAIHVGCIGVEADVWLLDDDLLVGHERAALQPNRTFQSLYVNPLVDILTRQNPKTEYYNGSSRGVFDTNSEQTLVLLVDVKTDGEPTYRKVLEQLEPLRSRGWLSTFDNGQVHYGPITVVGTGNAPFEVVVENSTRRDTFFDAPLDKLEGSPYDSTNSYYASSSFGAALGRVWFGELKPSQRRKMRGQLREAHRRGLMARYWDLPAWPINVRNHVWETLVREGMDLLNVDDLKGAARKDWTKGSWV